MSSVAAASEAGSLERLSGKALLEATRAFTAERPATSWFHTLSTLALLLSGMALAARPLFWPLRLCLSAVLGLLLVRMFVLYHDHLHGALLRGSLPARALFWVFGIFILAPPKVWRETHNYHHAHNAKLVGSHIGSYPTMTVQWWQSASPRERRGYAFVRHPITVLFAWFTAFLLDMCLLSFFRSPRKRWDSLLAFVVALAIAALVIPRFGFAAWFFALFLPHFISTALGAYLFYAQHNYPDLALQPRERWSYNQAALESSSYMETGPVLAWFTANIGYHHVHHLNPGIPFYRLPEAMQAIPELQDPGVTRLTPAGIAACFRLKLWDPAQGRMVGYPR